MLSLSHSGGLNIFIHLFYTVFLKESLSFILLSSLREQFVKIEDIAISICACPNTWKSVDNKSVFAVINLQFDNL